MKDRFWMRLARFLPRKLIYWAAMRVVIHAVQGRYSETVVPELTAMEALKRWESACQS